MTVFWNRSLLARLISSFLILSLVITGVASIVAFVQATDTLEDSVVERLRVAARARQDELNAWMSTQANDLAFVAHWEDILQPTSKIVEGDPASLDYRVAYTGIAETLRDIVVRRPDFAELFILDNTGMVVVSSQRTNEGRDLSDSPFYMSGRTQTFIQNVYPAPRTGRPTMTIATPLLNSLGERIGVLAVHLNLDRMDRIILDRAGLGATGEMYLVDKTGVFVSAKRFGRQDFTRQVYSEGINRALAGESNTGRYLNYRGVPVIGAYEWLEGLELALLVEMEEREAFAPINRLALSITLAGGVAGSILVISIYILARQIAQPILQLTEAARKVAAGDLHVTAPVVTQDEIGVLAHVFNQMTRQLGGLYERMEQQVAERTTELTQANRQLTSEIAERRRIEMELRQAKEDAEAANRAKSTFLANMSHELRTPLSAIIGFAQLMQYNKTATPEQREYLQVINRSGQHLRDLINDVLEMSKIEAGRTTLDEDTFDLYHALDELTAMFKLRASEKLLDLRVERDLSVPMRIFADEGKLRQILINLIGNAIKFTRAGHVVVRVSNARGPRMLNTSRPVVQSQLPEHGMQNGRQLLHFEVEDTGPGISPEDISQLFSAFFQAAATRNEVPGTGLGLAISYQYAVLMGGDLTVESQVGRGSTFRLTLPVAVMNDSDTSPLEAEEQRVVRLAPGQPPYRVLVAEDAPDSRLLLVNLLNSVGFAVRGVQNGKECIEQWEMWRPHLIWMDLRMPEMNGYEATQHIKRTENGNQTVVIALTASAFEEERTRILAAGCDDFVRKPFRVSDIFEHMAKHLGVRYEYESDSHVS